MRVDAGRLQKGSVPLTDLGPSPKRIAVRSIALVVFAVACSQRNPDVVDRRTPSPTETSPSGVEPGVAASDAAAIEASTPSAHARGEVPALDVTVLTDEWGHFAVDPEGGVLVARSYDPASASDDENIIDVHRLPSAYLGLRHTQPSGQQTWAMSLPGVELSGVLAPHPQSAIVFGAFMDELQVGDSSWRSTTNPEPTHGSATALHDQDFARGFPSLDGFVMRVDEGAVSWLLPFAGYGTQSVNQASELSNGDYLFAGNYVADLHLGDLSLRNPTGSLTGSSFVALVGSNGVAKRLVTVSGERPVAMAVNASGMAVVATQSEREDGASAFRLSLFDAAQNELPTHVTWSWTAAQLGGLALDDDGHVYLAVTSGDFHEETFLGLLLNNEYALVKLTPDGNTSWVKRIPGRSMTPTLALRHDAVAFAGSFRGTIDLGGGPLSSGNDDGDVFFAEFELDGSHRYSFTFGANEDSGVGAVAASSRGWAMVAFSNGSLEWGTPAQTIPPGEHVFLFERE